MDWQKRLETWIENEAYKLNSTIKIVEADDKGKGEIEFSTVNGVLLHVKSDLKYHFSILKEKRNADGLFFEFDKQDNLVALHLVELKVSVSPREWSDIQAQMRSTLKHALAILGVLNISLPAKLVCHSGYQNDKITEIKAAAPIMNKALMGKMPSSLWQHEKIVLSNCFPKFENKKHKMIALKEGSTPTVRVNL